MLKQWKRFLKREIKTTTYEELKRVGDKYNMDVFCICQILGINVYKVLK